MNIQLGSLFKPAPWWPPRSQRSSSWSSPWWWPLSPTNPSELRRIHRTLLQRAPSLSRPSPSPTRWHEQPKYLTLHEYSSWRHLNLQMFLTCSLVTSQAVDIFSLTFSMLTTDPLLQHNLSSPRLMQDWYFDPVFADNCIFTRPKTDLWYFQTYISLWTISHFMDMEK